LCSLEAFVCELIELFGKEALQSSLCSRSWCRCWCVRAGSNRLRVDARVLVA
jgi:hypothetical protein